MKHTSTTGRGSATSPTTAVPTGIKRVFYMGEDAAYLDMGWAPITVGLITSEKAWRREMKRMKTHGAGEFIPSEFHAACHEFENDDGHIVAIVAIDAAGLIDLDPNQVIGTLVHECTHVWQILRDSIGEHRPSHEFEAYQLEWIVKNLLEPLSKSMDQARSLAEKKKEETTP